MVVGLLLCSLHCLVCSRHEWSLVGVSGSKALLLFRWYCVCQWNLLASSSPSSSWQRIFLQSEWGEVFILQGQSSESSCGEVLSLLVFSVNFEQVWAKHNDLSPKFQLVWTWRLAKLQRRSSSTKFCRGATPTSLPLPSLEHGRSTYWRKIIDHGERNHELLDGSLQPNSDKSALRTTMEGGAAGVALPPLAHWIALSDGDRKTRNLRSRSNGDRTQVNSTFCKNSGDGGVCDPFWSLISSDLQSRSVVH